MWNNAYGAFSALQGLSQSQRGNRKRASIQNGGKEQWWFIASKAKQKAERLFWRGLEGNLSVQKITSKLCLLWCASIRRGSKGIISQLCSMFCSVWIWVAVVFSSQRECLWTYLAMFFPLILRLRSVSITAPAWFWTSVRVKSLIGTLAVSYGTELNKRPHV